jgi:hypothetical protein
MSMMENYLSEKERLTEKLYFSMFGQGKCYGRIILEWKKRACIDGNKKEADFKRDGPAF